MILYSRRLVGRSKTAEETIAPERTARVRVCVGTTGRHETRASGDRVTPGEVAVRSRHDM